MKYKLFSFLFLFILLLGTVSALNLDNVKSYDSNTKTATFKNSFGLGKEIATAKLETPQINYILALGYQKVFEIKINSKEFYNNPISKIETYDTDSKGNLINREQKIDLKYWNGTEWIDLVYIPEGEIIIAGFTDVQANDYVEWIPTMFGEKVEEWAIYAADPFLKSYWKLDEGTGTTAFDSKSGNNITLGSGVVWNTTGKIGNALNSSGAAGSTLDFLPFTGTQNFSIFGWIKTSSAGAVNSIMGLGSGTVNQGLQLYIGADDVLHFDLSSAAGPTGSGNLTNGAWRFVGVVWNGTHIQIYVDGVKNGTPTAMSPNIQAGGQYLGASAPSGTTRFRGGLDEFGIWNRTLTDSEVSQLYNSNNALQFPFVTGGNLSVTPLSPSNNQITNTTPSFSWLITPNISSPPILAVNISNSSLYIFNQSYMSLIDTANSSNGLVAYYKLDGNANDETGMNNFSLVSGTAPTTNIEGETGGALYFSNHTTKTRLSANSPNNNFTATDFTLTAWIRSFNNSNSQLTFTRPIIFGSSTNLDSISLTWNNSSNSYQVTMANLSGNNPSSASLTASNIGYTFITMFYNSTSKNTTLSLNANSIYVSAQLTTGQLPRQTPQIWLGAGTSNSNTWFNGSIDEVMIFNRSLSANEIYTLYNQSQPRYSTSVNTNSTVQINATLTGFGEGTYNWTAYANGINSTGNYVGTFSVVQSFSVDNTLPIVNITYPRNAITYFIAQNNLTLNYTYTEINPSVCSYNYNSTTANTTILSCLNTTFQISEHRDRNITVFANDTAGNLGYNESNWSYYVFQYSTGISSPVLSGSTQTFVYNFSSQYTPSSIRLIYNGSANSATISNPDTDMWLGTVTMQVPLSNTSAIKNLYWNVIFSDGTVINSSVVNQAISPIIFAICSTNVNTTVLNVSARDEVNNNQLNFTLSAFFQYWNGNGTSSDMLNYSYANTTDNLYYAFCVNPASSYINVTATLSYSRTGYGTRSYYFTNSQFSNMTQNLTLYLLNSSATGLQTVNFVVVDQFGEGVEGAFINIQKWDIGTNTYNTVNVIETDPEGKSAADLQVNVAWYRYQVTYNGILYLVTAPLIETQTTRILTINTAAGTPYNNFNNVYGDVSFNNNTNVFTFTFADTSGSVGSGCLEVIKMSAASTTTVAYYCINASSGTTTYTATENGTYVANGIAILTSVYGSVTQTLDSLSVTIGRSEASSIVGSLGFIIFIILFVTVGAFAASSNSLILGSALGVAALIFAGWIGWIAFSGMGIPVTLAIIFIFIGIIAYRKYF